MHPTWKLIALAISMCLGLLACDTDDEQEREAGDDRPAPTQTIEPANDAANTGHNRSDGEHDKTPADQSEDPVDLNVTATLRRAVVGAPSLSSNAKNIKIITASGVVTLRGVVDSDEEKRLVDEMANAAAAGRRVDNQLEVVGVGAPSKM